VPTSLLDYPGEVAAVIFTPGCNFRCPYCHNPELVFGKAAGDEITVSRFFDFLEKRKAVLGGVCITGGEPFIHDDLNDLVREIQTRGLKVKVDTNGSFPQKLRQCPADYFAMDLKTSPAHYHKVFFPGGTAALGLAEGSEGQNGETLRRVLESLTWLKESGRRHHFRTTAVPGIVDRDDFKEILQLASGETVYYLSGFRPEITLDPAFAQVVPYGLDELEQWRILAAQAGLECIVRGNLKGISKN
jgi:pyruvate formate lyase activating enzyme